MARLAEELPFLRCTTCQNGWSGLQKMLGPAREVDLPDLSSARC